MKKDNMPSVVKHKNKKYLSMFIVLMPSLLLAMTSIIENLIARFCFQIVLFFMQYVLVKNLIDSYAGED